MLGERLADCRVCHNGLTKAKFRDVKIMKQRINFARCLNCNVQFNKEQVEFKERPAGKDYEVGLDCPNCGLWFHSFFLNEELKEMITAMALQTNRQIRRAYDAKHKKFNAYKRKQLGMRKVNGRWYSKSLLSNQKV